MATSFEESEEIFLQVDREISSFHTAASIAYIRHEIDTLDAFYESEQKYFDETMPVLEEYMQNWSLAMLRSSFRPQFEEKYGELLFINTEMERKCFSPEIIPALQQENALCTEYAKLIASAQIPFEGDVYTLSQMTPFKQDPSDERRAAAWNADAGFFNENGASLDRIYDELVSLRDKAAKTLGYKNYVELGYYRMTRNCYTSKDIEKFRAAVIKYLVPVADSIYRKQAETSWKSVSHEFCR